MAGVDRFVRCFLVISLIQNMLMPTVQCVCECVCPSPLLISRGADWSGPEREFDAVEVIIWWLVWFCYFMVPAITLPKVLNEAWGVYEINQKFPPAKKNQKIFIVFVLQEEKRWKMDDPFNDQRMPKCSIVVM